ncbi:sigma-70 family RNA polymerase sigma factor [Cytobacillus oceanisediminis]|uniref:sigma-70 family RNA polymerase sigma factor n=1 Tax=Cytobacillus oceanisediminis TaxID=665099 RepID=UPI001FB4930B|nr:sigma-70 family RNA polymerase sigma factor [Cytobacillus oceanisediminis]UOE53786.1 sigma-70 family RNA polymerase sigma factor [Cytobacillus oceanisediminis]
MKQEKVQAESRDFLKQKESCIADIYPSLQRYSRFLAQNSWDGDDLAHEAIIRAYKSYSPEKINQALLKKIAYNCWMDILRNRKREQLEESPESEKKNSSTNGGEAISHLINRLTLKQAVIFTLKEGFRYKTKEIADILQTTEFAVKSSLNRARKQLQLPVEDETEDSFANDEEEKLFHLLQQSVAAEDPSILVKTIPFLRSLESHAQKPVLPVPSPSNTLCMAA